MINVIKKILRRENLTMEELNLFVTSYVEKKQNKIISADELSSITELIKNGVFNIIYAAKEYAKILGYQPYDLIDLKKNLIIKSGIYEL